MNNPLGKQLGNKQDKYLLHERIPTKTFRKYAHEFDLYLVQDVRAHSDSIWVARFSPCGQYLATGGKDAVLKIWQVSASDS